MAWNPGTTINHFGNVAGRDRMGQQWDNSAAVAGQAGIEQARMNIEAKDKRFNQIFPYLAGQIGQGNAAMAGGQSPPSPEIRVGGVWNPQQVQQQVNAARAGNDQQAGGQMQRQQQELASRGFGSNSPLLMALRGQTQAANMATNTSNEREIRQNAQQQNVQQILASQQAREGQFASRQREDIERRKPYWANQNALIAALSGLA